MVLSFVPSMLWYALLAVLGFLFVLSVSLPVPRRVWALAIFSAKYLTWWVADVLGVRRIWLGITGRGKKHSKLTRPMLLRMF